MRSSKDEPQDRTSDTNAEACEHPGITLPEPPEVKVQLPQVQRPVTSPNVEDYRQMGVAYSLPIALITPVLVLTLIGAWLDSRLGGQAYGFTLGGAILGLIVGVRNMLGMASRLGK